MKLVMYAARRQSGFKVRGTNENYLKSQTLDVPKDLSDALPGQRVRLAVRHATGFYKGVCPPMVSIYLVPGNGAISRERTLVETMILTPIGSKENQVAPLQERWQTSLTSEQVRAAVERKLPEILRDYVINHQ